MLVVHPETGEVHRFRHHDMGWVREALPDGGLVEVRSHSTMAVAGHVISVAAEGVPIGRCTAPPRRGR